VRFRAPRETAEALEFLAKGGEGAQLVAGGTALVPMLKQRLIAPELLVSLARVPELRELSRDDEFLRLGACVTHRTAETSALVREAHSALADTFRRVATVRIRNAATVGGSLAHADPNQDPPVTLLALGAQVCLRGGAGTRVMPLEAFFVDYYETVREPGELLEAVQVPLQREASGSVYLKFLPRTQDDYATVSSAAWIEVDPATGECRRARIALGCVGPTPFRVTAAEALLVGELPGEELLREAAERVREVCDPLSDTRGSADYKRDIAGVFVRRAIARAWRPAREADAP